MRRAATDRPDPSKLEVFSARPRRAVWTLAAPMIGGMLLHVLYTVVDTAFVGRLGPHALGGLTLVFPLFFLLIALANGVGTGITVLIAQAVGRQDHADAEQVSGTAVALGIVLGLLFASMGLVGGRWLLSQLGAEGAVADAAWEYFSVLAVAAPLPLCGAFLRGVLTGQGNARTPMMVMGLATLANIALDPLLIFTAGMGISGAAVATAIAQGISVAVLLAITLRSSRNVIRLRPRSLVPRLATVRAVLAIGLPASLSQMVMALGGILINRVVASFGVGALAGYGAANRVDAIVVLPMIGLAGGAVTVIGMFAGAARVDLVRSITAYVVRFALGLSTSLGVMAFLARGGILRLFTDNAGAIAVGRQYLGYMVFVYPLVGVGMVCARLVLALGHANLALLLTVTRLILVAVPIAYGAVYLMGAPITSVWCAMIAGAATSTTLAVYLVRRLVWKSNPTRKAASSSFAPVSRPSEDHA